MDNKTFLDLATQWKYQGFSEIELVLLPHVGRAGLGIPMFISTVERLLKSDVREAEGYMAGTLDYAEVKGVVRFTLGGGREQGQVWHN